MSQPTQSQNEPLRNIELKARYANLSAARPRLAALGATETWSAQQIDTYFKVGAGRLKLRQSGGRTAQLIWYDRTDQKESRDSRYYLADVADAQAMIGLLAAAFGVRGTVRKHRTLFMLDGVRIHLDVVEGLGQFVEFEAVLAAGLTPAQAFVRVEKLKQALGIAREDLVGQSYSDLLGI